MRRFSSSICFLPVIVAATLLVSACRSPSAPSAGYTHPTGDVILSLSLGGRPHGVAAAGDVFVVSQIDGNLVTRGTLSGVPGLNHSVPVGSTPAHVAISANGSRAYTTNQYGNSVSVVDLPSQQLIANIPLSDGGFNLVLNSSGSILYATTASGTLHVIHTATRSVVATLPVGSAANGLALHEASSRLYVSSRDAATVTAIDTRTNQAVRTYTTGGMPQRIAVTRDGSTLYVATELTGLERLDTQSGVRANVPGVSLGAVGLALSPDGAQLYVAHPTMARVTVVDRAAGTVVRTYGFASSPRNVAFNGRGDAALITDEYGKLHIVK